MRSNPEESNIDPSFIQKVSPIVQEAESPYTHFRQDETDRENGMEFQKNRIRPLGSSELPKTVVPFLIFFMKRQPFAWAGMLLLPMAWGIEMAFFPYLTKMMIDALVGHTGSPEAIFSVISEPLLLGGILWGTMILMWRGLDLLTCRTVPAFQAAITLDVTSCVLRQAYHYFSERFTGTLGNKVADLTRSSWEILSFLKDVFIPQSFAILLSMGVLSSVNGLFFIVFTGFVAAHLTLSFWYARRRLTDLAQVHSEARSAVQGHIVDLFINHMAVRLFAQEHSEMTVLAKFQEKEKKANHAVFWGHFKMRSLLEIPSLFVMGATILLLVRGLQGGWVSLGDVALIVALSFGIMQSAWHMGLQLPQFFQEIGVCRQALSLLEEAPAIQDRPNAQSLQITEGGRIVFENVTFFHRDAVTPLFENLSLEIPPGQKVGLVGFSGSGKTSFAHLILRLYDIQQGCILIDGQDITHVTQESLRRAIGMIPQDTTLFHRTVLENICYGTPEASQEEIASALHKTSCAQFIDELPEGVATFVGERGAKLSGGQRQRVALARVFLKKAPLLILDEATSALDSFTEAHIQETLKTVMEGRTSLVIAHRLSTLLSMDRILVFEKGKIVEDGSHTALLAQKGLYTHLWAMQTGGFLPDRPTSTHLKSEPMLFSHL